MCHIKAYRWHDPVITIAATRLNFSLDQEVANSLISATFGQFADAELPFDLNATIVGPGSSAALLSERSVADVRWFFEEAGGRLQVARLDGEGGVVWRMEGASDFAAIELAWHPVEFEKIYGTFGRSLSVGLGYLLLGMRLRLAGGVMLHGAAIDLDGHGIICTGVSGVGKSTISRLLHDGGATVLTDERSVIRRCQAGDHTHRIYGTPWPSSAGFARNESAPLRALYFLEHGERNEIIPLTAAEAIRRLIPVSMVPWQAPTVLDPFLKTLEGIVESVPAALLRFTPTGAAVELLRERASQAGW